MKRFFLMLLCATTFLPSRAQDIIVTTTSERIDSQIFEVSETEVKYKRQDNPNGPTFIISTTKIDSIIFQNGSVQTFELHQDQSTKNGTVVSVREAKDIVFVPNQKLETSENRNKYYYGDVELDGGLYKDFLKLHCSEAYKQYTNGEGMIWFGLFGGAMGLGAGLGMMSVGLKYDNTALIISGTVVTVVAPVAISVPLIVVGGNKRKKALDTFNRQCASVWENNQALTINLGVNQNGIGVSLNF